MKNKSIKLLLIFFLLFSINALAASSDKTSVDHTSSAQGHEAHSEDHGASHDHPINKVLLSLFIILLAAKIGGDLAIRIGQPEVLGELCVGLLLGNLTLIGITVFDYIPSDNALTILSELGVILLLFEVGLETSVSEMTKVGVSSLIVALLGVFAPFLLGVGISYLFLPDANILVHVFIGATLTATSVGITARVLKDLGKVQTKESKIILGAAVIDDVLGLITLAVVVGLIQSANSGVPLSMMSIAKIITYAFGFLFVAIILGRFVSPFSFKLATFLRSHGILLVTSLLICFGLSYLASLVGLAPIVGAFTAGLILEPIHYEELTSRYKEKEIDELIAPITTLLVPIFFVVMGASVDLSVLFSGNIIVFALVLSIVAIIGKQVCSFGVVEKGVDKISVGLGMIPRGEVGLIFAGIGKGLSINGVDVVDSATFGAVVIMVIVTTVVTPPLIKWRFAKIGQDNQDVEAEQKVVNGT